MVAIAVVTLFVAILAGMGISVCAFGTGGKRPKVFEDIYFSVEDVNGMGIVYTKGGDYSAVLKIKNPIRKYSASKASYYEFTDLFTSLLQLLGEGYALHKQDVFVRKQFDMNKIAAHEDKTAAKRFLSDSYFRFFNGRTYVAHETYLIITQKGKSGTIHSYDTAKWKDFLVKLQKVHDRLNGCDVESSFLGAEDCRIFADRFFAMDFNHSRVSMSNFRVTGEEIGMGNNHLKVYSLLDVDQVGLPGMIRPYSENQVGNSILSEDLLSALDSLPDVDTLVYNQVIFLPNQKKEVMKLDKKKNRHASIPNPNNQIAVEDIEKVQSEIARNGKMLVYAHYNMVIKIAGDKDFQKITNSLENMFSRHSIHISKRAYNQLELFVASFPGNCFKLNEDYDRFLTLSEPALCLMYKEHQQQGDNSPLKCYYTDRQGLPLPIDITGKEGKVKYTNNSNFFVLGPSGSGKSFFMNSVMRQYYEQDTDVVIVDTGDSYEGICNYFEGTYISYSKEKPISMNPFKITELEYEENFGEKKNFLKSLVFQLFKGTDYPTKIEDTIINQTITECYEAYFHPFEKFSTKERSQLKEMLLLEDKRENLKVDISKEGFCLSDGKTLQTVYNIEQTNFSMEHPQKWEQLRKSCKVSASKQTSVIGMLTEKGKYPAQVIFDGRKGLVSYSAKEDAIHLAPHQLFESEDDYMRDFSIGLVRSTRKEAAKLTRYEHLVKEELLAHMGGAMIGQRCKFDVKGLDYNKYWKDLLKQDPGFTKHALTSAEHAVNIIFQYVEKANQAESPDKGIDLRTSTPIDMDVDGNGIIESQENMAADTKQGENEQAHDHKEDTMLPHASKSKCSR